MSEFQEETKAIQNQLAVSKGAAQLLRQINLSLGRESTAGLPQVALEEKSESQADETDDRIETNTVVENECDNDF